MSPNQKRLIEGGYLKAVDIKCDNCGARNTVYPRASVYWNAYEQDWRLEEFSDDYAYCSNCEGEVEWTEVPMSRQDKAKNTFTRRNEENESETVAV